MRSMALGNQLSQQNSPSSTNLVATNIQFLRNYYY
uniref:Uncharacterized protein n=1 Tax=Rhizophora mucronata TaxID=61149 RepID=A0A2P2P9I7_RHIMU